MTSRDEPAGAETAAFQLLWGGPPRPGRGPKPALSLAAIADAAIAVADAEGLAALSMERVAAALNFTKMSLYRYVPGKTELVAVMIDRAMGAPPDLAALHGWRAKLVSWAEALAATLAAHPWVMQATVGQRVLGPNELGWMDRGIGALEGTGLRGDERMDAALAVAGQVRNVVQQVVPIPGGNAAVTGERFDAMVARALDRHGASYPALRAALADGGAADEGLQFGLALILDGIAGRIAGAGRA